jgi:hypothetical protein
MSRYNQELGYRQKMEHNIAESFSPNQLCHKRWLVNNIPPHRGPGHFEIIGSWLGYPLIDLLTEKTGGGLNINKIECYDLDPHFCLATHEYATAFNHKHLIETHANDYWEFNHERPYVTHIICTATEHIMLTEERIQTIKKWCVGNPLFIVQGTNMRAPDHINPVSSVSELVDMWGLKHTLYRGNREFPLNPKTYRYMAIGYMEPM